MGGIESSVGRPVRGINFFDREDERRLLWQRLRQSHVLLLAPRRVGKTSLLLRLADEAAGHGFRAVYVSVADARSDVDVTRKIIAALAAHPASDPIWRRLQKGPFKRFFSRLKARVEAGPLSLELALMALSVGGAIGSWALARSRYGENRSPNWAANERKIPGFELMQNKYYVDEIYQATVIKWFMGLRLVFSEMDRWIVDGIVNGLSVVARGASWVTNAIDQYIVDGAVNFVAEGTLSAGDKLRTLQTGRIQNYVYGLLGGVAFFSILQYFLK